MSPLTNTKFWKRTESDTERLLRERVEKLEAQCLALDGEATEMEKRLSAEIEALRKIIVSGSIIRKPEEGENLAAGRPIFSQRRANAMARSSATQKMAERIAQASPAPKENSDGRD